jgi:hypothetical protein
MVVEAVAAGPQNVSTTSEGAHSGSPSSMQIQVPPSQREILFSSTTMFEKRDKRQEMLAVIFLIFVDKNFGFFTRSNLKTI